MPSEGREVLADLTRVKALFQQRAIVAHLTTPPVTLATKAKADG